MQSAPQATGYSRSYDLREAMDDAVNRMPPPPPIADWLARYEILSMSVERGGIAGFDHLAVTLRRYGRTPV